MKPVLFNTEMVKAILDGRKSVTRRVIKPQPDSGYGCMGYLYRDDYADELIARHKGEYLWLDSPTCTFRKAKYQVGDILWVRETWQHCYDLDDNDQIVEGTGKYAYKASPESIPEITYWLKEDGTHCDFMPWKPSIHMPKKAARIFLKVTNVKVERVQDISEGDVSKEGIVPRFDFKDQFSGDIARQRFSELWDSIYAKRDNGIYVWDKNPWVWCYEFERVENGDNK